VVNETSSKEDFEKLQPLPQGWVWTNLGDLTFIQNGYAFKSYDYKKNGIPLLRISNIENHQVNFDENSVFLDECYKNDFQYFLVGKGDIVIALSGATTGKYGIYKNDYFALLNQRVGRIVFFSPLLIDPLYIQFYMEILRANILKKAYGMAQPNISTAEIAEFYISLPPLSEQHRIVARIEELFTQLDAGVASLMKVQAQLRRYRQAVLKAAFEGRLTQEWREEHKGEIEPAEKVLKSIESERITSKDRVLKDRKFTDGTELFDQGTGWIDVRIGDVVECLDHMRIPVNKEERAQRRGSIPYFGANGRVDWIDDFIFNEPLVLVVEDETFVGREIPFSYKITGKSWVNNHAHVLKPKTHVNIDFLNYSLMFYPFTKLTSGITGRRKLTKFALMNAPFKLPLIREQNKIVSEIERHFSQIDHLENTIITSLRQADSLRQSILKRAFEGKLVPQDPNDEPASVLLERIKAEKARHQTEAKKVMNTQRKPRSRRSAHAN